MAAATAFFAFAGECRVPSRTLFFQSYSIIRRRGIKMRSKVQILVALATMLAFCASAEARVCKVFFNVFTHNDVNSSTPQTLRFEIDITDSNGLRGPDAVNWNQPFTVTIPTSPNPTVYNVQVSDWEEWSDGFFPMLKPGSTPIPTGIYTLTFTDKAGRTFTATETLSSAAFLPASKITQTPSSTVPNGLVWTAIKGASYYRIRLKDNDWGEPVYWYPKTMAICVPPGGVPNFVFPAGVIRTGHHYSVSIEARDNDKHLTKRSRSLWATFVGP
jgi:hypothetical protein